MTDRGGGGGGSFSSSESERNKRSSSSSDTFKSGIFGEFSKSEENGNDAHARTHARSSRTADSIEVRTTEEEAMEEEV